jgi:hypothetical protein
VLKLSSLLLVRFEGIVSNRTLAGLDQEQEPKRACGEAGSGGGLGVAKALQHRQRHVVPRQPVEIPKPDGDATFPEIVESAFKHMGM